MPTVQTITPPTHTRWATVAQARDRLGLGVDQDNLLGSLIEEASAIAERIVGRPLARARYVESIAGLGSPRLRLSRAPVESVVEISLFDSLVASSEYEIGDAARAVVLRVDRSNWQLTCQAVGRSNRIPAGGLTVPGYAVDYWAGYVMPDQTSPPSGSIALPAHLRQAALSIVASLYHGARRDPSVARMDKADRAVAFFQEDPMTAGIHPRTLAVLEAERDLLP